MSAVRASTKAADVPRGNHINGWHALVIGLLLTRLYVPAEGAAAGHALWIALPWLILLSGRLWWHWRNGERPGWSWNRVDFAALIFVGAHAFSAIMVLSTQGERRAALNSLWEWLALAAAGFLLKETLSESRNRTILTVALLAGVIGLSLLGIWQHFLWYPRQSAEVTELLALHDRIAARETISAEERTRFQELVGLHGTEPLAYDSAARQAFLARIRDSREPIGRFALANTFASLLTVGSLLLIGTVVDRLVDPRRRFQAVTWQLAAYAVPVLVCLLLTKSRTAWLAFGIGATAKVVLSSGEALRRRLTSRQGLILGILGVLILTAAIATVVAVGGLDKEVLTEAPKSLQYRWEYWRATVGVIGESPWFGVGPGNFRQHYLKHKLPGSSEEVLDPHNLFLDVWANAGIVALGALIVLMFFSCRRSETAAESAPDSHRDLPILLLAGTIATAAVLTHGFLFEGFLDEQMLVLGGMGIPLAVGLHFSLRSFSVSSTTARVSLWTLWISLLAAGGIGMPAVVQWIWVLLLLSLPPGSVATRPTELRPAWLGAAAVAGLLACGCLWTGLLPVVVANQLMALGEHELVLGQRWKNAERRYEEAASADPLGPEPHHRLAEMFHWVWRQSGRQDLAAFERAMSALQASIDRDPFAPKRRKIQGEWWLERWEADHDPVVLKNAIAAFEQAADGYPHFAPIQAGLAFAQAAANDPRAVATARRGLELDDLNRARGHTDKLLPEETRQRLDKIVAPGLDGSSSSDG